MSFLRLRRLTAVVLYAVGVATAQELQCPQNVHGQAARMLTSNIARGQGAMASSSGTGLIEMGLFYQALRESIGSINNESQKTSWSTYLHDSLASTVSLFTNVTATAGLPLDRLSIGTEMIRQWHETGNESLIRPIQNLQDSAVQQQRNANGGLWYYANPNNFTAYQNLSYLDGMYSYPTFAILSASNDTQRSDIFGAPTVLKQLEILAAICDDRTGLLVHGYDALRAHKWANPETGSSPAVWGRSLAWYTLGVVEALSVLQSSLTLETPSLSTKIATQGMRRLFNSMIRAQCIALERGLAINGRYGVWQVVDLPGATINGTTQNFVESSASLMTAYSLLKSVRLDLLDDPRLRTRAIRAGIGLWENIYETQVTTSSNGTEHLGATSSIASLSGQNVDAQYYVTRPTVDDSLIGTSAFILASLEVEKQGTT